MTCEELREDYDTFALGLHDGPESGEIRDHLRQNCPNCVPGVRDSLAVVMHIASLAKAVNPPARLRERILASVNPDLREERPRTSFGWSLAWAATSVLFLAAAVLLGIQLRHVSALRQAETGRLEEALSVMSAPDSREVTFGTNRNAPPRGKVIINRRRGVVLIASNLPRLESGKTFEMWLIPSDAKPIPAVTFGAESDGTGLAVQHGEVPENLGVVAVTVENEGGASAPTTTPIIAAETK